jgi:hypothetical protein
MDKTADLFLDPPDTHQILASLSTLETCKDIVDLINRVFPNWIVGSIKDYSKDYSYLSRNWKAVCKKAKNVKQTEIIVVSYMIFDKEHVAIAMFAEMLTASGYCVRRVEEIGTCEICSLGIPSRNMWTLLKENKMHVPKIWSPKCSNC